MESVNNFTEDSRSIYRNLSPLDHRYFLSNKETFEALSDYLSEEAAVRYLVRVEIALLKAHLLRFGERGKEYISGLDQIIDAVDPREVYAEEEKTQHNIRALVNVLKRKVPREIGSFIHAGATSADILDTAQSLRIKDAVRKVILPELVELLNSVIEFTLREAATPQVGRTHGQHAVPITLGFWMAEFVARIGKSALEIERLSRDLRGKFSGAVGAYNATSLIFEDPEKFEKDFLDFLGIQPSEYSHQLVEPEYLLRLLLEINTVFGIIANLADDLRNLQRSEIAEVRELFGKDQVGSSTMPQKRNPWNSEHVKSLWKAFSPRVMSFYLDQISEHQRDLTNSASSRFISEYLAGFAASVGRMNKIIPALFVDRDRLLHNLRSGGDLVLAEAAYILLAESGEPDAHEKIRKCTLNCEKNKTTLREELKKDSASWETLSSRLAKSLDVSPEEFFSRPELYRGRSAEKAKKIAEKYSLLEKKISEALNEH
jgi:adenylosuccinate lyase